MVRSVKEHDERRAFALPTQRLAEVWPHLKQGMRRRRSGGIHPIFDLIDREDQILRLGSELGKFLKGDAGSVPHMVFALAGAEEEDHQHLRRRLRSELGEYDLRGPARTIDVADLELALPKGGSTAERLDLLMEQLRQACRAEEADAEKIAFALKSNASGWLIQLMIEPQINDDEGDLLDAFLTRWRDIVAVATCETYLCLSFTYCPKTEADTPAALWHGKLLGGATPPVDVAALDNVRFGDISRWMNQVLIRGHLDDEGIAEDLAFSLEDLFAGADRLPMRRLRSAIRRAALQVPAQ
jgi:hypothetical protein